MLDLATHIVATKAGHLYPEKFEDHYERALRALVKRKQRGEKIERPRERPSAKVIDLMEGLRQSAAAGRDAPRRNVRRAVSHAGPEGLASRTIQENAEQWRTQSEDKRPNAMLVRPSAAGAARQVLAFARPNVSLAPRQAGRPRQRRILSRGSATAARISYLPNPGCWQEGRHRTRRRQARERIMGYTEMAHQQGPCSPRSRPAGTRHGRRAKGPFTTWRRATPCRRRPFHDRPNVSKRAGPTSAVHRARQRTIHQAQAGKRGRR
jgi:hypothetical protein